MTSPKQISYICFDTVGLVTWPLIIVPEMTHDVLSGTLSLYATITTTTTTTAQPTNKAETTRFGCFFLLSYPIMRLFSVQARMRSRLFQFMHTRTAASRKL